MVGPDHPGDHGSPPVGEVPTDEDRSLRNSCDVDRPQEAQSLQHIQSTQPIEHTHGLLTETLVQKAGEGDHTGDGDSWRYAEIGQRGDRIGQRI